jgi:hypothetical protein
MPNPTEQQIAADLALCDMGLALTTGKTKAKYAKHRKACFKALRQMNVADGLNNISDEDLLAELA